MIMVRTVFQTKWGKADQVVQGMKEMMNSGAMGSEAQNQKAVLMTDLSGEFHTVVMEARYESLAAFEQFRARMFAGDGGNDGDQAQNDQAQSGQDIGELILSGRQEYYTIEAEF
jgi:hypothetical protein